LGKKIVSEKKPEQVSANKYEAIFAALSVLLVSNVVAKDYQSEKSLSRSSGVLSINLSAMDNLSGLQFQIDYSDKVRISNSQSCLDGVPATHKGAFTTCKVFEDKRTMLVVVSDIGKVRRLNSEILGFVEYASSEKVSNKDFTVSNLVMMDVAGKKIDLDNVNPVKLTID